MLTFISVGFCSAAACAAEKDSATAQNITIGTVDNRPIYIDRLIYTALREIGYNATIITSVSLKQSYELANNHERDGVISSSPDMLQIYPDLRQVPVELEYNNVLAFVRDDSGIHINTWEDLGGLRVGMLTARVYMLSRTPNSATVITRESTKLLMEGLTHDDFDVVLLSLRAHEMFQLPPGVVKSGLIEILPEYLYLHKSMEDLIPDITQALQIIDEDGRKTKILSSVPMPELYPQRTVIHLLSGSPEIAREEQFSNALREHMRDDMSIEWYTIALDSTRFSDDESRLTYFANILRRDCVSRNIAAIIVSGEDALSFLRDYYNLLFRNVPVLFYGVDATYTTLIEDYEPYFTGVVEHLAAYETVETALRMFPNTKRLYVINDYSTEGRRYQNAIKEQLQPFTGSLAIEYNANSSRDAMLQHIKGLPTDSLIFVGSYFCDSNGQYFSLNEMKRALEADCPYPVFALYSTEPAYNSVGGKCLDYEKYAEHISFMLQNLLAGQEISTIPVNAPSGGHCRWVFDNNLLRSWHIQTNNLPADAFIINMPPSIWKSYPRFVIVMSSLMITCLIIVILTQFYRHRLSVAMQAAEEASKSKTVFLANMSHEIRTPMNAIVGFTELALDMQTSVKVKDDYLKNIRSSSKVLLNIINDILDISKIEAGKIILENIPFEMHTVFEVCKTIILPKADEKGITLYFYTEPSIGKRLLGDPSRLQQALINLLSNAVKFTNTGMVKLMATIENTGQDSVTMRFEVKDSGIGMSREQIKKIFEPFMQADASTTRQYGGTGLGLPIAKNIIELMGGKLNVESTLGVGSKFSFSLTFKTIENPAKSPDGRVTISMMEKPLFQGKVLVCEDNSMNQQVIFDHLSRVGLETVIAANGQEGVDLVRKRQEQQEQPFDMIFMDIHMPVMDGLEAAKALQQLGNNAPVIALTANIMPSDQDVYRSHGMYDFLAKPFSTQELWSCLLKYLTPINMSGYDREEEYSATEKQSLRLRMNFVEDNRGTLDNIRQAIDAEDIELAHRLAHTLKGVAALVGKPALQEAAHTVELMLANDKKVDTAQLKTLERELNSVLAEFSPLLNKAQAYTPAHSLSNEECVLLFETLEQLLETNNTDCLDMVEKLQCLPGTDMLVKQIEAFDFKMAHETLLNIKESFTKEL